MRIRLFLQVSAIALATTFLFGCNMMGSSGSGSSGSTTFALSGISPSSGSTAGGTAVTINGNNLQSGDTVSFGGQSATSVKVAGSNQIVAVTPAHAAGWVDVAVTDTSGESATLAAAFGYGSAGPAVSTVSPNSGPITGGTSVKISGSNFAAGALVFFGAVAATGVTVTGPTQIQAVTPSVSTAAAVSVMVKNPDGQSGSLPNGFTYSSSPSSSAPTVSAVSPSTTTAGTDVQVDGTNFASGATVTVGSAAASNVQFVNSAELTATVPNLSPGSYDVTVANTNGLSATLSSGLTVSSPQGLLSGCTVNSTNTVNWGAGNCPASVPSGWTDVVNESFEGGKLGNTSIESLQNASVECTFAHGGSCAIKGSYSSSEEQYFWTLAYNAIGSTSHEVDVSWWQYDTAQETTNGNNFIIELKGASGDGGPGTAIENFDQWPDTVDPGACLNGVDYQGNPDSSYGAYLCQNAQDVLEEFHATGGAGVVWGGSRPLALGSWTQWELHYKANTPGNSDGDAELYRNGQEIFSASGNLNASSTLNGMLVEIGTYFEDSANYTDSSYTTCAPFAGATGNFKWLVPFTSASPCPVPPNFTKYWDDIIVLKK